MRDRLLLISLHRQRARTVGEHRREVLPDTPAVIIGALSSASGIGNGARLMASNLKARGLRYETADVSSSLRISGGRLSTAEAGPMLDLPQLPRIVHLNPPHFARALHLWSNQIFVSPVVAYWAWELPRAPAAWLRSAELTDEIWVPSEFVRDAVLSLFTNHPNPPSVRLLAHPTDVGRAIERGMADRARALASMGRAPKDFIVGFSFSMLAGVRRKNPEAVIRAFQLAFPKEKAVHLLIRIVDADKDRATTTRLKALCSGHPGIHLVEATKLPVDDFYTGIDVFLSLQRSEGYGLMIAEALGASIPVIATGWSLSPELTQHRLFHNVPSRLVPVDDHQGPYEAYRDQHWAEPDLHAAAQSLRDLWATHRYAIAADMAAHTE